VLLDLGQLNLIGKLPAAATPIERILADVYCTTLDYAATPHAPFENTQRCWMARSGAEWQRIRERFGVHQVLVPRAVPLALPEVYATDSLRLYEIPAEAR
jgi:hypothetical protein